jgi:ATP/maltotriose-dependent transcriptional regulator MalT
LIALQQYTQAADLLSRFSQNFDQQEERLIALEWMALSVVALCPAGKREHAQEVAARLLSLTEPEGSLRVYLDTGPLMKQALKMFLEGPRSDDAGGLAISMSSVTRILSAFEQEEQRRASGCDACSALLPNKEAPSALLEPLTAQELSVLRQLAAGRSNREIAERLVVSLNTVKTHLKHLYSKLAVNSRLQASTRAREPRLL